MLQIDRDAEEPVFRQIAAQIRDAIASGELRPERQLPTVRTLASDLGVNLNTVARAYRVLEDEGFVVIHGRSRVIVAAPASSAEAGRRESLVSDLRSTLARLRQAGLQPSELRRLANREIDALRIE